MHQSVPLQMITVQKITDIGSLFYLQWWLAPPTIWWIENNQISLPIRTGAKNVSFLVHQHNILIDMVDRGDIRAVLGSIRRKWTQRNATAMETQRCRRCSIVKTTVTMAQDIFNPKMQWESISSYFRIIMWSQLRRSNQIPNLRFYTVEYMVPRHWAKGPFYLFTHYPKCLEW